MSDTPKTDALRTLLKGPCLPECDSVAHAELCPYVNGEIVATAAHEKLERELNAANAELASLRPQLSSALVCVKCGQRIPHSDYSYSIVDEDAGAKEAPFCAPCVRSREFFLKPTYKIVQHP